MKCYTGISAETDENIITALTFSISSVFYKGLIFPVQWKIGTRREKLSTKHLAFELLVAFAPHEIILFQSEQVSAGCVKMFMVWMKDFICHRKLH